MGRPDLFKTAKAEWIEKARNTARRLLTTRAYITAEDVIESCPLPRYLHRNTIGCIFQCSDFRMVGMTRALRPSSNGRRIFKWALRQETTNV